MRGVVGEPVNLVVLDALASRLREHLRKVVAGRIEGGLSDPLSDKLRLLKRRCHQDAKVIEDGPWNLLVLTVG